MSSVTSQHPDGDADDLYREGRFDDKMYPGEDEYLSLRRIDGDTIRCR